MLIKDAMGGGMSAGGAQALFGSTKTGISSAGSSITDATDLTAFRNVVGTVSAATTGVQLLQMNVGESQIVYNSTATPFKVYPGASTIAINQFAVGVGVTIPPYSVAEFHQASSTQVLANLSA